MRAPFVMIKFIIILGVVFLFAWTAYENAAPSGTFKARYDFKKISPFITSLLPGDRTVAITSDTSGAAYQAIIGDPVYFRLNPTRSFETVEIEIRFKNEKQKILEVGALAGRNPDVYDLYPLENKILDNLSWQKIFKDDLTLYQRRPVYKTVDEFLKYPPRAQDTATYHAPSDVWQSAKPSRLMIDTDLDRRGIDFILAEYEPPKIEGEWKVGRAKFDLSKLRLENRSFVFVISAPLIAASDTQVFISGIDADFKGKKFTLWQIIEQVAGKLNDIF